LGHNDAMPPTDRIEIIGLRVPCRIGTFPKERRQKQWVVLDIAFPCDARKAARRDRLEDAVDYHRVAQEATRFVERQAPQLLETLAEGLAGHLLGLGLKKVDLRVSKPAAIPSAKEARLSLRRARR